MECYILIYVYIYIYLYLYIYIYIYTFVYLFMYMYIYTHTYTDLEGVSQLFLGTNFLRVSRAAVERETSPGAGCTPIRPKQS